ncbi:hypothetical protein DL96DRAFT_1631228 [Flagelloscypha sp. PMI_526]|nr:hypothetical protein DL96DRAFT_1631228 [Flagelloscypha sp. PMI_526]
MMFSEELMRDCGADFYLHTYDDLHTILLDLCQANNVTIHYDKDVTHVERTQDGVRVLVCNGGKFDADVLVAADGRDSVLRSSVSEAEFHETANLTGLKCWVPFSRVAQDPELALLADENIWTGFLAPGFAFNISAFPQNDEIHLGMAYLPQDAPNVIPSFHTLHPSVQKFLELGKDTMVTGTFPEYKVEEWVGLGSRGILIGDAAHASTIYSTYNTSMSVEDGAVLAELFADVTTYAQIPFLLSAFEEIRQPRANTTSYTEYMRFLVLSLPDGPEKEQRNMALGATLVMKQGGDLDLGESEMLAETWSDFVQAYAYDSKLAAREWLQVWGKKVKEH